MTRCSSIIYLLAVLASGLCDLYIANECNEKYCLEKPFKLPDTMVHGNKTYYFNKLSKLNWFNAALACKRYNMQLVTLDSYSEFQNVKDLIIESVGLNGNMHIWVGGTDLAEEGRFTWINGKAFELALNWAPTQPDNAKKIEHCLEIGYHSYGIKFNDLPCNTLAAFICESERVCGNAV
ncbi:PREDICTED: C-type lectin 37Da-like [Nicrophorus vespilloides]|uniref:C-type lectin 37Da-like n=1 Tax=Nicrophorus vespilloides TaxID=110193 RepID=A0ABM1NB16_NICVS|nr:PREDICTED: C-type lectin 37Da-like [Nicrophorus vespilloides]